MVKLKSQSLRATGTVRENNEFNNKNYEITYLKKHGGCCFDYRCDRTVYVANGTIIALFTSPVTITLIFPYTSANDEGRERPWK